MSYCRKCGAYIPDGSTKCLSCGYDEAERQTQSQQQTDTEERPWREYADEERRRKMDEAMKWAAEERRKFVQQQKEQQPKQNASQIESSQRIFSIMSYIFALCVVPYIVCPQDKYVMYHARQGLYLFIIELIAGFCGVIPVVGGLVALACWVYAVYAAVNGIKNAANGVMRPLKGVSELIDAIKRR